MLYDPDQPPEPAEYECDGCGALYPAGLIHVLRRRNLCAEHFLTEATAIVASALDYSFSMSMDQLREVERLDGEIEEVLEEVRLAIRSRWSEHEREQRELARKARVA